jgi:hypothetical protein
MALYERPLEPVNVPRSKQRQKARDDDYLRRENDYLRERLEELQHTPPTAPPPPPPARRAMSFGDLVSWLVLFALLALIGWLLWPIIWPDMQSTVSNEPITQPAPTSAPVAQPPIEQQQPGFVSLNELSGGDERHTPIDLPAQSADLDAAAANPELEALQEQLVTPNGEPLRFSPESLPQPLPTHAPAQPVPEYSTRITENAHGSRMDCVSVEGQEACTYGGAMIQEQTDWLASMMDAGLIGGE